MKTWALYVLLFGFCQAFGFWWVGGPLAALWVRRYRLSRWVLAFVSAVYVVGAAYVVDQIQGQGYVTQFFSTLVYGQPSRTETGFLLLGFFMLFYVLLWTFLVPPSSRKTIFKTGKLGLRIH